MARKPKATTVDDRSAMERALELAARAYGDTSPNPLVGAVLVRGSKIIGEGWHHRAGLPHAEIEALRDAEERRHSVAGATLYVTLEPCCTHGRTPPCTDAIIRAGIRRVVAAATDPNPKHAGHGFDVLRQAGVQVETGLLESEATALNQSFNHWIVHRTPFVTVKAAMSLDGKIATKTGESKWITGPEARAFGMHLRRGNDAIIVGVRTVLADNPALILRRGPGCEAPITRQPRRIILDSLARCPKDAQVIDDEFAANTVVVVTDAAPVKRVAALTKKVKVWVAPRVEMGIDLKWLLTRVGQENITSALVEGGGEVNASLIFGGHAQRVAFFYAPKVIGGRQARMGVAGEGVHGIADALKLDNVQWSKLGDDLLLQATVGPKT